VSPAPNMRDVIESLRKSSKGTWNAKKAEKRVAGFLTQDVFSMPSLGENPDDKQALMRIRLDSRGHAVKRTILGFKD
jgi:hypothetical protein